MAEHLPRDPKFHTVDIVQMLNEPRFNEAVSYVNALLAAFSNKSEMSPEDKASEQEALNIFNSTFFGLSWLERPARICAVATDDTLPDSPLGICSTNAKFIGAVPYIYRGDRLVDHESVVFVQQMAYRALSLVFIDDTGTMDTLPLDKSALLSFEVDTLLPYSAEQTPLGRLLQDNELFSNMLRSETFLQYNLETQQSKINEALSEINTNSPAFGAHTAPFVVSVVGGTGNQGVAAITGKSLQVTFTGYQNREQPYTAVNDYEYGTELMLQITSPSDSLETLIPASNVLGIDRAQQEPQLDTTERIDLLNKFFNSGHIMDELNDAENYINAINDEDERLEAIVEKIDDLSGLVPDEFFDQAFLFAGEAFYAPEDGECKPYKVQVDGASLVSFDIQFINNRWRVTLPLEIDRANIPQIPVDPDAPSAICHVLPYGPYTTILQAYECEESIEPYEDEDLIETCSKVAADTKHVIASKRFRTARLERQTHLLQECLYPLINIVNRIAPTQSSPVHCLSEDYYAIDTGLTEFTCADIAEYCHTTMRSKPEDQRVPIQGTIAGITLPETYIDNRTERFSGVKDFPLSKGEPMLIIENTDTNMVYFVPARSIKYLAPQSVDIQPDIE